MSLLYKGNTLAKYVVDRVAVDMSFDTIRLQIARDFDGQELSEDLYHTILEDNKDALEKRRDEIRAEIERQNPVNIVFEAVQKLREVSLNSNDPKDISAGLSTLRGYLEMLMKKVGDKPKERPSGIYVQQNFMMSLEDMQKRGLLEIKDRSKLLEFVGVTEEEEDEEESEGESGEDGSSQE